MSETAPKIVRETFKVWTSIEHHIEYEDGTDEYTDITDVPTSLGEFSTEELAIDQCTVLSEIHMSDGDIPDAIEEFLEIEK